MQKQKCVASGNSGWFWLLWGSCEMGQERGGGGGVQQGHPLWSHDLTHHPQIIRFHYLL